MISTDNVQTAKVDYPFTRFTAAELASQKFELTYLPDGALEESHFVIEFFEIRGPVEPFQMEVRYT